MHKVKWTLLYGFVANFIRFPVVWKFRKSVKIWQSYREVKGGNFFETQCKVCWDVRAYVLVDYNFSTAWDPIFCLHIIRKCVIFLAFCYGTWSAGEMRWMHSAWMWFTQGSKCVLRSPTLPGQVSFTSNDQTSGWRSLPNRMWTQPLCLSFLPRWWPSCSRISAKWPRTTSKTTLCWSMNCLMVSCSSLYIVTSLTKLVRCCWSKFSHVQLAIIRYFTGWLCLHWHDPVSRCDIGLSHIATLYVNKSGTRLLAEAPQWA